MGNVEGQLTVNNLYYQATAANITAVDLGNFLVTWRANEQFTWRSAISSDWFLNQYRVTCLTQPLLATLVMPVTPSLQGAGPANHLPTTNAIVLSKVTNLRGQHGRGRIYMPAIPTTWVALSVLVDAGGIQQYQNLAVGLTTDVAVGALTWHPVVPSFSKLTPRTLIGASTVVNTIVRTIVGTVRRRRLGKGR
jgi:hypothetical protein